MKEMLIEFLTTLNIEEEGKLINENIANYIDKIITHATIVTIIENNVLNGFIAFYENDGNKNMAYLTMIAVRREKANLGYGRALLEISIKKISDKGFRNYGLEVRKDNINAIKLYESLGFKNKKESLGIMYMENELK